jgi:hypothetical protein
VTIAMIWHPKLRISNGVACQLNLANRRSNQQESPGKLPSSSSPGDESQSLSRSPMPSNLHAQLQRHPCLAWCPARVQASRLSPSASPPAKVVALQHPAWVPAIGPGLLLARARLRHWLRLQSKQFAQREGFCPVQTRRP